jgi:hypothetical protein
MSDEFLQTSNQNQNSASSDPKEKVKAKSKTKTGALVGVITGLVILVAVGIGAWLYFIFLPKVPRIIPLEFSKTYTQDELSKFFAYTEEDYSFRNSFLRYDKAAAFDLKDKAGNTVYSFPRGLYLDTKAFIMESAFARGENFSESKFSLPPALGQNDPLCDDVPKTFDQETSPFKITNHTLIGENKFIDEPLTLDFAKYKTLLEKKNEAGEPAVLNLENLDDFPKEYHLISANKNRQTSSYVLWQSSDPSVLAVYPDGKIFPLSVGKAEVRAVLCGKEMARLKVEVSQQDFENFNPYGKLDTKFVFGQAQSKKFLISSRDVPLGKYIKSVTLKPKLDSPFGKDGKAAKDLVLHLTSPDTIDISGAVSPVQGKLEFILSNDGGKTWVRGDKKIDNTIKNLNKIPEIKFNFNSQGQRLKLAILWQADFDQTFFTPEVEEKPTKIANPYAGSKVEDLTTTENLYLEKKFNFQTLRDVNGKAVAILPLPSPVLSGLEIGANYENISVVKLPDICKTQSVRCASVPFERAQEIFSPKGEEGISFEPVLWHRGHSRVVLKWKFVGGAENNLASEDIDFKYGKSEKEINLGAKVYQDKNDKEYPYYVVMTALLGGEYSDKNNAGYEAGRFKYFYQIKAKGKESPIADFKTLNRLQTIGYYYDLILGRVYVSGENSNLAVWENLENKFGDKKIADLESGGLGFFYKPKDGEPLTLLGIKFAMLNDRKYQEYDKGLTKLGEEKGVKDAVSDLYRKIHDRIYEEDLGKFFDSAGVEYWASRLDEKIVGKDVMDIFGVKFYMSVSPEYQQELFGGLGVTEAKPELAYQIVLKRGADAAGLTNLKNKYQFAKDMRKELAMSEEYKARVLEIEKNRGRKDAIDELYETLYARAADVLGRDFWDKSGLTALQIRDEFLKSKEFLETLE